MMLYYWNQVIEYLSEKEKGVYQYDLAILGEIEIPDEIKKAYSILIVNYAFSQKR